MNKVLLIALLIVCSLGCTMWSIDAWGKTLVHKQVSKKKALTKTKSAIKTKVNPKDGAEMVLVPAGEFLMGSKDDDKLAVADEKPQHKVYLDSYYICKTEVTVAQYRKFCEATKRAMPKEPSWKWHDNHPIVNVSWNDAAAYSKWAGVNLPTEAQWEKAARGTDGRIYPWGNKWDEIKCANWSNSCKGDTPMGTHSVGSFPTGASPYGCLDMSGNVWEWCADWYGSDYYKTAPAKNPTGPKKGDDRVLRGGGWHIDYPDGFRVIYRSNNTPTFRGLNYGFRCVLRSPGGKTLVHKQVSKNKVLTKTKSAIKTKVNSKDGAEMVLVPVGDFLMGSKDDDKIANNNEKPQHKVYLDSYYIYKTEVTVAQYKKFCKATKRAMPEEPFFKWQDTHPIVSVTWNDAVAYAKWAGVSLPTEAQWEKAARGTDGRIYPWGNEWDKTKCANWLNSGKGDTPKGTHSVGSFPTGASPYGVMDMSGNVWEWCADWYGSDYYKNASAKNPTGPATGYYRVLRGGSWGGNYVSDIRGACRGDYFGIPDLCDDDGGFRCASPGP